MLETRKLLHSTSAQDEFAKWAKLRRKFDGLINEYEDLSKDIAGIKMKYDMFLSYGIPSTLWTIQIFMLVWWSAEPVFYVPEQWFGPLTSWLKFPFAPLGSVGVFYWWSALKSILDRSSQLFVAISSLSASNRPQMKVE